MATPNFARPQNASKYFVVLTSYQDEETGETVYPSDWAYDDLKENIGTEIESIGGNSLDEAIGHDINYHRQAIGSLSSDKYFGDINVELEIKIVVQSAYYEGATLDYLISIYNGGEMIEVEDGYYKTTVEDIVEDLFETKYNDHDYSTMNKGMRMIQSKNAVSWLNSEIEKLSKQIETILETYSEHKLNCAGVFSNGEAVYTKAS